jgi:hypothetical protein
MDKNKGYLVGESSNRFQLFGRSPLPWHEVLPIMLTQGLVDSVTLYPDADTAINLNAIFGEALTGSSLATIVTIPDARRQLDLLAPEYALLPNDFNLREGRDIGLCKRYLADPSSFSESDVKDLVLGLRSRNIQAVVVQILAMRMGWWSSSTVAVYISLKGLGAGRCAFESMVEAGFRVDQLYLRLLGKFIGYVCDTFVTESILTFLLVCRARGIGRACGGWSNDGWKPGDRSFIRKNGTKP